MYSTWAGHVARMVERRDTYRVLVGKPEGKRPLGRTRHRWENNIKIDVKEMGWLGMDWIDLIQDFFFIYSLLKTIHTATYYT